MNILPTTFLSPFPQVMEFCTDENLDGDGVNIHEFSWREDVDTDVYITLISDWSDVKFQLWDRKMKAWVTLE